jgi:hypothetical protein
MTKYSPTRLADPGPQIPQPSDRRLKEDIHCVGVTAHELPLYTFRYRGREGVYEGVMAQEVLAKLPGAVSTGEDGFYRVDYDMLGVKFRRLS